MKKISAILMFLIVSFSGFSAQVCTENCPTPEGVEALNQLCRHIINDSQQITSDQFSKEQWFQVIQSLGKTGESLKALGKYAPGCNFSNEN
ncbi:hypothetical protein [Legionella israelensis]|uniref:Uncharacterized protein n=1 Tax=Legionella israelensis TaxID=454 RepID=A0A0W0WNW6_9GAMM|nr:hypothetical protein [Legionella israelensis]KTD34033.1 hypothetical protein Lisr_0211 [Legionella israelensis]QBS10633.1 hypothetical protein E4T55_12760 [Legionella israelensis]SCX84943.1 hypothetical protein SAMN02746069_00434 [Legionella israelensis DSM 19235]STX57586.1 Uncharacterised protein [Legionella israelensis]